MHTPPPGYGPPPVYGQPPQAAAAQYGAPPPSPPKKKNLGLFLGLGAGGLLLFGVVLATGIYLYGRSRRGALPVEANLLPTDTKTVGSHLIDATRENDKHVKQLYLASELGALCAGGGAMFDPAHKIESLPISEPKTAKDLFFNASTLADIKTQLDCGAELAKNLKDPKASYVVWEVDEKKTRSVTVLKLGMSEMPTDAGFVKENIGAQSGWCKLGHPPSAFPTTPVPSLPGIKPVTPPAASLKCEDDSRAAFNVGSTWFFGSKEALDDLADTVAHPKKELGTNASALKDAAANTFGFPSVRMVAQPKSSKDFFVSACEWGAFQSAAPLTDFMEGCFPKSDDKIIEEIDAKVKAAAWETEPDLAKGGAIVGNIVLVTRDADAAKDAEKAVSELVRDWKDHLDTHSSKIVKATKEKASTSRQKEFAAIVDTYVMALEKAKVSREGRTVRVSFNQPLTKEDLQSLKDAEQTSLEKRQATADILEAIQKKGPLPVSALSKLVGPKWATYLAGPPPAPIAMTSVTLSEDECEDLKKRLQTIQPNDVPSGSMTDYFRHKFAVCSVNPPIVQTTQKACLATIVTGADYGRCMSGVDPREPPVADYGTTK